MYDDRRKRSISLIARKKINDDELVPGNVLAQRSVYRLSPLKNKPSIQIPYTIEERLYYYISEDKTIQPLGKRSVIFRGGDMQQQEEYAVDSHWSWSIEGVYTKHNSVKEKVNNRRVHTRIGQALYVIDDLIDEEESTGRMGRSIWDKYYIMALYCVQHPDVVSGTGLEIGSGVGIGAILSVVGSAVASNRAMSKDGLHSNMEPTNDTESSAPVPASFSKIILTDTDENMIMACIDNLNAASFPGSKAEVGNLDLNKPVNDGLRDRFDFILGADCAHDFPSVGAIANFVSSCLKKRTDYNAKGGSFLHIGPKNRENIHDLIVRLARGYNMDTEIEDVVLQRFDLVPVTAGSIKDMHDKLHAEIEGMKCGYVEYQRFDESIYSAVYVCHNQDPRQVNRLNEYSVDEFSADEVNDEKTPLDRRTKNVSIHQYKSWQKFHNGDYLESQPSTSLFKTSFKDRNSVTYDSSWFERASPSMVGMAAIITAAFIGFRAAQVPSTTIILYDSRSDVTQTKMLLSPSTASSSVHTYSTMKLMNPVEVTETTDNRDVVQFNEKYKITDKTGSKAIPEFHTEAKVKQQSIEMERRNTDADQVTATDHRVDTATELNRKQTNNINDIEPNSLVPESRVDAVTKVKAEVSNVINDEVPAISSKEKPNMETKTNTAERDEIRMVVEVEQEINPKDSAVTGNILADHSNDLLDLRENDPEDYPVLIETNAKDTLLSMTNSNDGSGYVSTLKVDETRKEEVQNSGIDLFGSETPVKVERSLSQEHSSSDSNVAVNTNGRIKRDETTDVDGEFAIYPKAYSATHNGIRTLNEERVGRQNDKAILNTKGFDNNSAIVLVTAALSASALVKQSNKHEMSEIQHGGVTQSYLKKLGRVNTNKVETHSLSPRNKSSLSVPPRITTSSLITTHTFSPPTETKEIKQLSSSRIANAPSLNESNGQSLVMTSPAMKTELYPMMDPHETEYVSTTISHLQMNGQSEASSSPLLGGHHEQEEGYSTNRGSADYLRSKSDTVPTSNSTNQSSQTNKSLTSNASYTTTTKTTTTTTTTTTATTSDLLFPDGRIITIKKSGEGQPGNIISQSSNTSSSNCDLLSATEKYSELNIEKSMENSVEYWSEKYVEKIIEQNYYG